MSTTYTVANIQHALMALKEKIDPDKWGDTPLPIVAAPGWWLEDLRRELALPDGEIAEIHDCPVIQMDTVKEPMLLDHDGKLYPLLPQWLRAKQSADAEGGEA